MPKPRERSRSQRKVTKRTPGNKSVNHYSRRKKNTKHYCAVTHEPLKGMDSSQGIAKTKRTPNRKFGGHLTPAVTKEIITYANRVKHGLIKLEDVPIRIKKYIETQLK